MFTDPNIADDVAFADEPGGVQHSSSHSALILSRSIFVNHFLETVIDTVWQVSAHSRALIVRIIEAPRIVEAPHSAHSRGYLAVSNVF